MGIGGGGGGALDICGCVNSFQDHIHFPINFTAALPWIHNRA